jgi:peptide/nickel transport system permease protein
MILLGFARRLLQLVPVVIAISIVTFLLTRLSGDPSALLLPLDAPPEQRQQLREELGLDEPLPVQYLHFVDGVVHGDFGDSFRYQQPALEIVLERAPATLQLAAAALFLALAIGLPLGIVAALRHGGAIDNAVQLTAVVGQALPSFYTGLLAIVFIAPAIDWLPSGGYEPGSLRYLILPACTLAPFMIAVIARFTRASVLDVLGQNYVRTARAKGIPERRVTLRHILRNALIPVVTVVGLQIGNLLGGAVITETVFGWPGIGRLAVESVLQRDFPVVQVVVLVTAVVFVVVNQLVDLLYVWLDPRIDLYRPGLVTR